MGGQRDSRQLSLPARVGTQPRDEEAICPVSSRQRTKRTGQVRVRERRSECVERIKLCARRFDHTLVLLGQERAGGVHDAAGRFHDGERTFKQGTLQRHKFGQVGFLAPPPRVGATAEHTETAAWGID